MLSLTKFAIDQSNQSAKKAILFIHGNSHSQKTWDKEKISTEFSEFNCIFYDLLGHGSAEKSQHYDIDLFVKQLNTIVQELKLTNYSIVGQSLGGHIAIQGLSTLQSSPNALICLATPALGLPLKDNPFNQMEEMNLLTKKHLSIEDAKALREKFINNSLNHKSFQIDDILATDSLFRTNFLPGILAGNYQDEIQILSKFKDPLLLLYGEEDLLINKNYYQMLLNQFPIKTVKSCGHNIHQEQEEIFIQILKDFIPKG